MFSTELINKTGVFYLYAIFQGANFSWKILLGETFWGNFLERVVFMDEVLLAMFSIKKTF